jgi:hypothetical protein
MTTILGVDVGGTFTDFLLWRDGRVEVHRRASTPDDPARAVLEGLAALGAAPNLVTHGSTVATNAVLERTGARRALVGARPCVPSQSCGLLPYSGSGSALAGAIMSPARAVTATETDFS